MVNFKQTFFLLALVASSSHMGAQAYMGGQEDRLAADGDDPEVICNQTPSLCTTSPLLVSTFQSISVYWNPSGGSGDRPVHVNYRKNSTSQWNRAHDLWFDSRNEGAIEGGPEYRGSVVLLEEDADYEIGLILYDSGGSILAAAVAEIATWSPDFPISQIIYVDDANTTYTTNQSGTEDGYVLYTPSLSAQGVIDVEKNYDYNIQVPGGTHHIIIRGFTLRGALDNGINLEGNGIHDVIIEENDISEWGSPLDDDPFGEIRPTGMPFQAAICSRWTDLTLERVVIQNNKIHHPSTTSISWAEGHPSGPQGIFLKDTAGNHVIRYNEVYSDYGHAYNDCIGGNNNSSDRGFPNKDSDIYGNRISECYDDGIESEGGNRNVRIWNNYINNTYHQIAVTVTHKGPIYIWRNIGDRSRYRECPLEPHVRCIPDGGTYFDVETCDDPDDPLLFIEVDELNGDHYEIRCRDTAGAIVRTVRTTDVIGCNAPLDRVTTWTPRSSGSCEVEKDEHGNLVAIVQDTSDGFGRGSFLKTSNRSSWGSGRVFLYHNTQLQREPEAGQIYRLGATRGPGRSNDGIFNHVARNNIFTSSFGNRVFDDAGEQDNDYDYSLFTLSETPQASEQQTHGLALQAFTFPEISVWLDLDLGIGTFTCAQGEDAGERLYNFNDGFLGAAPDMGAYESGGSPIHFGVNGPTLFQDGFESGDTSRWSAGTQ